MPSPTSQGVETVAAAPLAPGRIMLCGYGGNTWIATVDFDPAKGAAFHVFHEAKEAADRADREQWRNTHVAFHPVFMHTLTDPAAAEGAKPRQRVVLGRASDNIPVMQHPLLIDPQTLSVEPIADEMPWYDFAYANHQGSVYWVSPQPRRSGTDVVRAQLWRLGFPEFRKMLSAEPVSNGAGEQCRVAFLRNRTIVLGDQIFAAGSAAGPFRALRGPIPPYDRWPPPTIVDSAHFGTIIKLKEMYELRFAPSLALPDAQPPSPTGRR